MTRPTLLGIDIGGTFTDFVLIQDGKVTIHKRLTTPDDPTRALLDGLTFLDADQNVDLVHGTTIATNAILERKGARTAFVTTQGFADIIEIGRQNRPDLYALVAAKPPPLVGREFRFEVEERISADGSVIVPLDPGSLSVLANRLRESGVEAVAVCLLFSFLAPDHERQIGKALSGFLPVSLSSEILPEYREYERAAATIINAYVTPIMTRYLDTLETSLAGRSLHIMQSNGGLISTQTARQEAARTILSGPAGGAVGAFHLAQQAGFSHVITLDMGGTSTDVALFPGELKHTRDSSIGGMPLRLPVIDIHTIGAGGGSIARVDAGGALTVGPQSAGADPGPACYGRGSQPTITDANLVLGRLHPDHFLGGQMKLDIGRARDALEPLIASMGVRQVEQAALGIVDVANAAMERAIRAVSVERGYDPRDFALVVFGGAGPLHACRLAEALLIPRVIVPYTPGVLSALGMALTNRIRDYAQAVFADEGMLKVSALDTIFAALEERALQDLAAEGFTGDQCQLERSLDMRYVGQSHEIAVAASTGDWIASFNEAHERRYGYRQPESAVEAVCARLKATGVLPNVELESIEQGNADVKHAVIGQTKVWLNSEKSTIQPVLDRNKLLAGNRISGGAVIVQLDATTLIPPDWTAVVDHSGHLVATQ